jgi:hypothetical protein
MHKAKGDYIDRIFMFICAITIMPIYIAILCFLLIFVIPYDVVMDTNVRKDTVMELTYLIESEVNMLTFKGAYYGNSEDK